MSPLNDHLNDPALLKAYDSACDAHERARREWWNEQLRPSTIEAQVANEVCRESLLYAIEGTFPAGLGSVFVERAAAPSPRFRAPGSPLGALAHVNPNLIRQL